MESWGIGTPESKIQFARNYRRLTLHYRIFEHLLLFLEMKPKEEYLSGVALVTRNDSTLEKEIVSFPETDLSKNVNERFNELFRTKDKWTVREITPYIS